MNNDGYPDIIVACTGDATIDVLFNNGAGGGIWRRNFLLSTVAAIQSPWSPATLSATAMSTSLPQTRTGNVSVLLNTTGNGTFTASHYCAGTLSGIVAGDFNNDGHLDLAVSDSANSKVYTLFTDNGTGNFHPVRHWLFNWYRIATQRHRSRGF